MDQAFDGVLLTFTAYYCLSFTTYGYLLRHYIATAQDNIKCDNSHHNTKAAAKINPLKFVGNG